MEAGFVYACALSAGNVTVCILQKRGRALGAYARLPSFITMSDTARGTSGVKQVIDLLTVR